MLMADGMASMNAVKSERGGFEIAYKVGSGWCAGFMATVFVVISTTVG
jgi:hypothetical protein